MEIRARGMVSVIRNLNYKWNNNRRGGFRKKGWYTREHWNNYAELVTRVLQSIKRGVYAWCDFHHLSPTMKFVANLPIICYLIRFKIPKEYTCMYHFRILVITGGENFMAFFMNLERGGFDRTMVTVGGMKSWARKFSKNLFDNFNYVQAFQIRISLWEKLLETVSCILYLT